MKLQLWWPHNPHRFIILRGNGMAEEVKTRKKGLRPVSYGPLKEAALLGLTADNAKP